MEYDRRPKIAPNPELVGDPGAVFAASLAEAQRVSPDNLDLLVPEDAEMLFIPREPFVTRRYLELPVGRQKMDVVHISDYDTAIKALSGRGQNGPFTTQFQPAVLRFVRRHFGVGHPNYGGPWMWDEPTLKHVRELISEPFKHKNARELQGTVDTVSYQVLVEALADNPDELDVAWYSNEVLFRMMARVMGVEESMSDDFRAMMQKFNSSTSLAKLRWQPEIRSLLTDVLESADDKALRGIEVPGLLGSIALYDSVAGERPKGAKRLTQSDRVSLLWSVIAAGTDTPGTAVASTINNTLQTGDYSRLDDPETARRAIEESIRIYPPFPKPLMKVGKDGAELGGYALQPGQWVEVHLPAANRDPSVFDRPHKFDIDRPNLAKSKPFGHGQHYCIGSHYGMMVGSRIVSTLARELPHMQLKPDADYRRDVGLLHRIDHLPVSTNL